MRKYLIGIFIGVALTVTSSVFANDIKSLIGEKIQGEFPVNINGKALDKPAIVINGTSYLPNRDIADALGMDIKFDADLGIELKNKEDTMASPDVTTNEIVEPSPTEEIYTQKEVDLKIRTINSAIWMLQVKLSDSPDNDLVPEWQIQIKQYQDDLAIWEARKATLNINEPIQ